MNKGFVKLSVLAMIVVFAFIAGFVGFTRPSVHDALATQVIQDDNCDHECPTFEFSAKECPAGYHEFGLFCEKNGAQFDLEPYNTFGPIEVTYNKSEDPNKCHRPSPASLDIPAWAVDNYNQDLDEHVDSIDVAPEGYYLEDGVCYPNEEVDVCENIEGDQEETPANMFNEQGYCDCQEGYHREYENEYEEAGDGDLFTCEPDEEEDYCRTLPGVQKEDEDCPEPEVQTLCTGNCGTPPTFAGSSTEAPVCTNGDTTKVVANGHLVRNGSEGTINAFLTEGDRVHVLWRLVGQTEWQHSSAAEYPEGIKPNADNFVTYTAKGLDPVGDYDFGILQANGCGGGTIAVIKDSYLPQVFTVTSYE